MQIKKIKNGSWYETTLGIGQCMSVGGTFPPSVRIDITYPLPRGPCLLKPRDVKREVNQPSFTDSGE